VSFEHTRSALAKIVSQSGATPEQRMLVEVAAALGELVKELEGTLDELRRKLDALAKRH
jgi:hypothetical protein